MHFSLFQSPIVHLAFFKISFYCPVVHWVKWVKCLHSSPFIKKSLPENFFSCCESGVLQQTNIFSAPEPMAQVHYCDHLLSVVRPSLTFHIFDFSSETTEQNSTKLDRKQELNILYQVCVFRVDRKNKMAALATDWLRHFRLLLWNCWTEFNKTW